MTLDEAIEHAKEIARTCDDPQCAADHLQLAEWLRQARGAEKGARWLTGKLHELNDENTGLFMENAKLREMVRKYAEIANYFCEREGYCSCDFVAQCRYYEPQQCKLGELNDTSRNLGIEVDG